MVESAETLLEFIARRRGELDALELDLQAKLAQIREEKKQLIQVEKISIGPKTPESEIRRAIRKRKNGIKPGTIMYNVLDILNNEPDGLSANDILRKLNYGREDSPIARESLSPQLSRMKQAGFIKLDGSTWKLPPKEDPNI